ncbi:MAG TPA: hypothetical protein VMA32_10955 [Streptosporangiaceae bacterium]|nr:hypothetical protein [Streptosporangiaceae bacterium]
MVDALPEQRGKATLFKRRTGTSGEHASRWRWLSSPALQGLLALAVYAAVWLPTVTRPLVSHLSQAQLGLATPDPNFYVWSVGWWPYAIQHGINPLYTNLIGAPAGHSLSWVTTVPPLALLAAPITLTAGPVAAFNLLAVLALPVTGWAAFVACRRLTGRFWPALVGGAVYGFSDYEVRQFAVGHLNLCYAVLPPILVYLVVAWRDGGIRDYVLVILAGLVLAVQFYLFLETFAYLTAILVISALVGLAVAGRDGRRTVLHLAGLLGLGYALALALAEPYLAAALSSAAPIPPPANAMDLTSLWLPAPGRNLGIAWLASAATGPHKVTADCSVGIPLLAVMIALAVTSWRSRLVWFLTGMFVVIIVGALGPVVDVNGTPEFTVPWHGVFSLPFVRNAYLGRLVLFAYLILALATALLLADVTRQWHPTRRPLARYWSLAWRWSLGALVVAFGVLNASGPLPLEPQPTVPAFVTDGDYHRLLTPGEIVLVISRVPNAGMLWQAASGFGWRLTGGLLNRGFDNNSDLPPAAQRLRTPLEIEQFEAFVRADHIGAILVDARQTPAWARVFGAFGLTGHLDGGVFVYPTNDCRTCHVVTRPQIRAARFPS